MHTKVYTLIKNSVHKIFILALSTSLLVFFFSVYAFSATRFMAMDKNNDKSISLEEFLDANPNLNANAYAIIDLNQNKSVSYEEWLIFQERHSQPEGLKIDADKITTLPAKKAPDAPVAPSKPAIPTMPPMPPMQGMQMPPMKMNTGMAPMKSMFDKNPNEVVQVEEVQVPLLEQTSNSLPLLAVPSLEAPKAPTRPNVGAVGNPSAVDSININEDLLKELAPAILSNTQK